MSYPEIITLVLGTAGITKALEILLVNLYENRVKKANAQNIHVQADKMVIENLMSWSQSLETKLKEAVQVVDAQREQGILVQSQLEQAKKLIEEQTVQIALLQEQLCESKRMNEQQGERIKELLAMNQLLTTKWNGNGESK